MRSFSKVTFSKSVTLISLVLTACLLLLLTVPIFLFQVICALIIPTSILVMLVLEGKTGNLDKKGPGWFVPLAVISTLLAWIILLAIAWELPKHAGIMIAIEDILILSVILIPGFGAGLLIKKGLKNFKDQPFSDWFVPNGLIFLAGSIILILCFQVILWGIAMVATG